MTDDERIKCHAVIHSAAAGTAAIGAANPLSVADTVPITSAQVTMIMSLGAIFGKSMTESLAKSIWKSFWMAYAGRFIAQVLGGWIPGVGNVLNATTAGALTEYIGWEVAEQFAKEREVLDAVKN